MDFHQNNYKKHLEFLIEFYTYFYRRVFWALEKKDSFKVYRLTPTSKNQHQKNLDGFLERNKENLISFGKQFYLNYFTFQFSFFLNEKSSFIKNIRIRPVDVLGELAQKRWEKRNTDGDCFLHEFRQKFNIVQDEIFSIVDTSTKGKKKNTRDQEEYYKTVHYNTELGLPYCVLLTSLWNPYSIKCISCKFKVDCKQIQKEMYGQTRTKIDADKRKT